MKKTPRNFVLMCVLFFLVCAVVAFLTIPPIAHAFTAENATAALGLAIASGLFGAGGGIAVALTGSSAISALTEKPEVFIRAFLVVSLAEAVAIYGLLLGIMVFGGLG